MTNLTSTPGGQPSESAVSPPATTAEFATTSSGDWIRDFYKECGREATLAYTTLNQMKNWAIAVQGTIIAAIAALSRSNAPSIGEASSVQFAFPVAVGSVLAYVFTLRFFVRALLCYINLLRWNTLQSTILEWKLLPRNARPGSTVATEEARREAVGRSIQNYYYRWRSPINRVSQVASNLKLGFGILLVVPPLLMIWSASQVWDRSLVRALVAFAVGATLIEAEDFFTSSFFDTADTPERTHHNIFPAPGSNPAYIARWVVLLILCALIALWPWLAILISGTGPLPTIPK